MAQVYNRDAENAANRSASFSSFSSTMELSVSEPRLFSNHRFVEQAIQTVSSWCIHKHFARRSFQEQQTRAIILPNETPTSLQDIANLPLEMIQNSHTVLDIGVH